MTVAVVVPTIGRPSLEVLLHSIADSAGPLPDRIVLVDDRRDPAAELLDGLVVPPRLGRVTEVRRSGGHGPAAARNAGWRSVDTDWVAFLDDDVVVGANWLADLAADLADQPDDVVASTATIVVPLPTDRRPTDWERGTAGLASAYWITADMAYRRRTLSAVGGFDERFRRAFREDADLALRAQATGGRIVAGARTTTHPVRPAPWSVSARLQRGNADDALMRALHGPDWYERAHAAVGRRPLHLATVAAGLTALGAAALRRKGIATAAAAAWAALTADFAVRRIAPGPRTPREIAAMTATSAVIPPLAVGHWLRGLVQHRNARPWSELAPRPVAAVLLDRDGTLVHDVPYNGDPDKVEPVAGVGSALQQLRAAGIKLGVVTNQSGVARGLITEDQVRAVNARIDALLGPFDTWQYCPHDDADGCSCRKPQPGLVLAAAEALGVDPADCIVVGDTAADVGAAESAGAAAVLVPNDATRPEEVLAARTVAPTVLDGVGLILGRSR